MVAEYENSKSPTVDEWKNKINTAIDTIQAIQFDGEPSVRELVGDGFGTEAYEGYFGGQPKKYQESPVTLNQYKQDLVKYINNKSSNINGNFSKSKHALFQQVGEAMDLAVYTASTKLPRTEDTKSRLDINQQSKMIPINRLEAAQKQLSGHYLILLDKKRVRGKPTPYINTDHGQRGYRPNSQGELVG